MLLERIIRWFLGWVRFEAEGGFPERLLNMAARGEIDLWDMRHDGVALSACCPVRQYRRLRRPVRRAGMRLRVKERHGVPFFLDRWSSRAGIAVGLALFMVVLHLFSTRVWVVEVRGNETVSSESILKVMEQYGVREGADLSALDIPALQLSAIQELPDIAWCVVNLSGSTAYIDVTERIPAPDITGNYGPSNIKAARDGRIVSVEAHSGQAMVKKGEAVVSGMLLISGVIDSSAGPVLKRAQGKVLAETTRRFEITVPLEEIRLEKTGETILRPYLHVFTLDIPLFSDGPIDSQTALTVSRHPAVINNTALPVGFINRRYDILNPVRITRTPEQAEREAAALLDKRVREELGEVEIVDFSRSGEIRDGQFLLTGIYNCVEDIAMEEPILVE